LSLDVIALIAVIHAETAGQVFSNSCVWAMPVDLPAVMRVDAGPTPDGRRQATDAAGAMAFTTNMKDGAEGLERLA